MAGVRFNVTKLQDKLGRAIGDIPEIAGIMEEMGVQAEGLGKQYIGSRPGAKTGKQGRIESGDMQSDFSHKLTTPGKDRFYLRVGFIKNLKKYYTFQDIGFLHARSREQIEGVHAIRDTKDDITNDLMPQAEKKIRKLLGRRFR